MSSKWVQWFHPGQRNQSLHGVGRWLANGSCKHWDRQRPTSERFAVRALISSGVAWQVPFFCKDASSSFIRTGLLNLGMRSMSRLSVCLLASAGSDRGHQPDWPCRPSTLNIQRVLIIYMHKLVVSRMSMWGTTKSADGSANPRSVAVPLRNADSRKQRHGCMASERLSETCRHATCQEFPGQHTPKNCGTKTARHP